MMDQQRAVTRAYSVTQSEWTIEASYAAFTIAFEALLGRMDAQTFGDLPSLSPKEARAKLESVVGPLDFVLFQKIDHGAIVTSLYQRNARAMTYVFGNALIAVEMTKHDLRAGLHVPLRLIVEEVAPGRVRVTYDLPSSLIARLQMPAADAVAHDLDSKVERLLVATIRRALVPA
jgi:uncharacterized protein (DUF302 family)